VSFAHVNFAETLKVAPFVRKESLRLTKTGSIQTGLTLSAKCVTKNVQVDHALIDSDVQSSSWITQLNK
jgi:hypothetical protein